MPKMSNGPRAGVRGCLMLLLTLLATGGVAGAQATKTVRYHGYAVRVPAAWPVYNLAREPHRCVRFDRHAVYLGRPGALQHCPAHAAGRAEAILIEPSGARSLGVRDVRAAAAVRPPAPARAAAAAAHIARAVGHAGDIYTGVGFDACSAPSSAQMSAWTASPYRAIGVYLGGANMACSQTNLTAAWISQQTAAGWHFIPTYVGLQAPTNSCGCAAISARTAATQGSAAATDAVTQAQSLGLGPGNPIYFDMEAYPRGGSNTSTVLAFLAAWTTQLHASGYVSGVYSSADSGIADLVAQLGTTYQEPDDLWIARWNGATNTTDPNVPSTAFAAHQRLHQYSGAHNETYGKTTLEIDGDYLDGATAGSGGGVPPPVAPSPSLSVTAGPDGALNLFPSWSGVSGVSSWQVIAGPAPTVLTPAANPVSAGTKPPIVIHSAFQYFAVQALDATGQVLGSSLPIATPAHVAIFGQSVFVSPRGTGGVPVGCFNTASCHVKTTISIGRRVLVTTGTETIPVGGGLAFFTLTPSARTQLARARGRRLAVTISVRDVSGLRAARPLSLIPFVTSGTGPRRSVSQSPELWAIGATDFVSHGWVGGILAACVGSLPCHPTVTMTAGGTTIARTGQQFLGVGQLGYLFFSLTPTGHTLLTKSRGNQLGVRVTITSGSSTASADIALVAFR